MTIPLLEDQISKMTLQPIWIWQSLNHVQYWVCKAMGCRLMCKKGVKIAVNVLEPIQSRVMIDLGNNHAFEFEYKWQYRVHFINFSNLSVFKIESWCWWPIMECNKYCMNFTFMSNFIKSHRIWKFSTKNNSICPGFVNLSICQYPDH